MNEPDVFLPLDVTDLDLSLQQIRFVRAMIENDYDEAKAVVAANIIPKASSPVTARMEGLKWANKPNIRQAVQRYSAMVLDPTRDQLHVRLVETLRIRAFYDPEVFFYPDGTARPLAEIPKEYRLCIDGITEDFKGKDAQVRVVTYKLCDRAAAQKQLQELLKRGEKDDQSDIPSDAKSRLEAIFASVAKASVEAGAKAAIKARKDALEEQNTIDADTDGEPIIIRPGHRNKPTPNVERRAIKEVHERYRQQGIDPETGQPLNPA